MARIALLGGTNFIGVHLFMALMREEHDVVLFNRSITKPPILFPNTIEFIIGDRNIPTDFENLFRRDFDIVFDISGRQLNQVKPIISKYRDRIGHYIFCSSTNVYARPPANPMIETSPRAKAETEIGRSKVLIEDLLLRQHKKDAWPITIVRPSD